MTTRHVMSNTMPCTHVQVVGHDTAYAIKKEVPVREQRHLSR